MSHLFQRLASTAIRPSMALKLRPLSGSIYAPPRNAFVEDAGANLREDRADAVIQPRRESAVRAASQTLPSARDENFETASQEDAEASQSISLKNRASDFAQPGSANPAETPHPQDRVTIRPRRLTAASPMAAHDPRAEIVHQSSRVTPVSPSPPTREPLLAAAEQARAPFSAAQTPTSAPTAVRIAPLPRAQMPAAGSQGAATPQAPHGAALPGNEGDEIHIHIGRIEVAALSPSPARPAPAAAPRKSLNLDEYLRRGNRRTG